MAVSYEWTQAETERPRTNRLLFLGPGRQLLCSRPLRSLTTWANSQRVKSPCLQQSEFENLCFDGIITAMFETLQPPRPEPAKGWFAPTTVYGIWCVLGAGGILISLWKHGTSGRVGFVCYATVLVLALY